MRRLLTIAVVAGAVAVAFLLVGASDSKTPRTYKIVLDNAFGLVKGGDFRVGGVRAGETTDFNIAKKKGHSPKAVVTAQITQPGFDDFRVDATCGVKPQSLIGEYYVDCQPGSSPRKLPTNGKGTVPVEHTFSTIPTDLVNNILRRPYRERLRFIIDELGTGLAGRPQDLQAVLRRAHPGLRETTRVLRILGNQNRILENFIRDSDTVVGELANNRSDVVRWVRETGNTAAISATRREALRQGFHKLPTFLAELRPTMARLEDLIDEQRPLLGDLRRAAPSLTTFFTRLGPFSQASRPALRSLGQAAQVGTAAFRKGGRAIAELQALAPKAKPTFKPLRQFLQTADDRRRATESNDQRAVIGGPPAPDPTHIGPRSRKGFTGLESVWNYAFWQSLDINGYDQVGHLLRVSADIGPCSSLAIKFDLSKPDQKATFDKCSQWLGRHLPGITMTDFTDGSSPASRARREPARYVGERRKAGQIELGPRPGQRDISRPQIVLPPQAKELIDRLRRGGQSPSVPPLSGAGQLPGATRLPGAGDQRSADNLLDFLLAP